MLVLGDDRGQWIGHDRPSLQRLLVELRQRDVRLDGLRLPDPPVGCSRVAVRAFRGMR
jgi:hypothetical protein